MRKMKTTITAFSMALVALSVISCSAPKKTEAEVKLDNTSVRGELGPYLEVVDGTYKVAEGGGILEDFVIMVKVRSKATTEKQFNEIHGKDKESSGGMIVSLLDADGRPIAELDELRLQYDQKDKLIFLLSNKGEEDYLKFAVDLPFGSAVAKNGLPDNISSFEVGSDVSKITATELSVESSPSTSSSSKTYSSADIDAMLDSYEQYTDKYIKFYKKAMKGDAAALSEYPALMEKAEEFSNKLEQADGDLSSAQMARMMEIQQKLMSAMSGG